MSGLERAAKRERWRAEIEAWRASGQTLSAWARERNISRDALEYWKRRIPISGPHARTRTPLTLTAVISVALIAVRLVTRPIKELAEAAEAFGQDLDAPPLEEAGPTETRHAAEAFNRMQERLKRLIAERSRALAAVSHDLRTPLTRLRLRAELVEDETLRAKINADIDDMQAMVDATLDYLRGSAKARRRRVI